MFGLAFFILTGFIVILIIILIICLYFPRTIFDIIVYTKSQPSGFIMKDYITFKYHDTCTASININGLTFGLTGGIYSQGRNIFSNNFYFNNGIWNKIVSLDEISDKEIISINVILHSGETKITYKKFETNGNVKEFGITPNGDTLILGSPLL